MLDRFHIMSHFSKAIDEVRAAEVRKLAAEGRAPVLKHSRWVLLKRPEHLTDTQEERLSALVRRNLRTVRAYLLKEDFQSLWRYVSPYWAGRFLDRWCTRTMRSRLDPMKKVARMLRSHRALVLNWFRAKGQFSSGIVEGFNGKARVTTKKALAGHAASKLTHSLMIVGDLFDESKQGGGDGHATVRANRPEGTGGFQGGSHIVDLMESFPAWRTRESSALGFAYRRRAGRMG